MYGRKFKIIAYELFETKMAVNLTDSERPMFDDSEAEDEPKVELFEQVKPLKPAGKKTAAKKPPGEKKPRAPAKKKADKGKQT